ncbi:beta-phosphoglucomutase [Thalassomonas viridans]|uniref:Beta-phosphoglucomutase n=1 Tax=Thalassomonas viridans TaxID=137584 RepID=A0AAF0C9U5_9GAMM|nr:beta-phosphoglucomutase [Thalassomonas viridans]WDE05204.1 beta-phosphoglucomutase [Thalassomonas viridans]
MTAKAFIFDLDGVLTDTAEFHFIAWQATAHQLGLEFTREDNEGLKGVDRVGSLQLILDKGQLSVSEEKFEQLLVEKNQHYLELINDINPDNLFPGVLDCFAALKEQGIKIGLASASKNAAFVVDKLGIADLFDFIGDAASVANSKPAPDIFLSVAQGLGLSPEDCIGVEDAVAGVTAIKSAGMYAVGIGEKSVLTQADIVFPTTGEMDVQQLLS